MRRFFAAIATAVLIVTAFTGLLMGDPLEPSASIQIDSGSFLKNLGFQLLEASVSYRGRMYRVRFYNVASEAEDYHASGRIYGLNLVDDIVGRYEPMSDGRVLISESGVEIVVNPPMRVEQEYVYVDYLGTLYARHDQSVQFGPRD